MSSPQGVLGACTCSACGMCGEGCGGGMRGVHGASVKRRLEVLGPPTWISQGLPLSPPPSLEAAMARRNGAGMVLPFLPAMAVLLCCCYPSLVEAVDIPPSLRPLLLFMTHRVAESGGHHFQPHAGSWVRAASLLVCKGMYLNGLDYVHACVSQSGDLGRVLHD